MEDGGGDYLHIQISAQGQIGSTCVKHVMVPARIKCLILLDWLPVGGVNPIHGEEHYQIMFWIKL